MAAGQSKELPLSESRELKSLYQLLNRYMTAYARSPKIRNRLVIDIESKIRERKALEKRWAFRDPGNLLTQVFERVCPLCQKIGHQDGYHFHLRECHYEDYISILAIPSVRSGRGRSLVMVGGGRSKNKK